MSYIVTGKSVATCHAVPRPVSDALDPEPASAVPYCCEIAGATGHVSGPPFADDGSCDMKSTATSPGGTPVDGTAAHDVAATPACGMRPNFVASYEDPPRCTVM